ncbi:hypothetical protein ZWY2020_059370 [Hordeum vulgare]|nr:hypothetical protein ZWY2020_059370 [Hordeum vulgare]
MREEVRSMEEHKLRAVGHLLRRESCKATLGELFAAVEEVAEELEDAYMDLGDEWLLPGVVRRRGAMHVGTDNDVTAYVLFVKDLVDSADDVRLLVSERILEQDLPGDDAHAAVVSLFNGLTRDVYYKNWESHLCQVNKVVFGCRMSSWVVDMEKKVHGAEPAAKVEKWGKHCIFRVPLRFKVVDASVYKPQTVSLGPFHHDDKDLKPMEEHKLRAVRHLLLRESCKTTLAELVVAIEEVGEELEDAYMELGDEWLGENRGKFLEMMIMDGCFLVEVMRTALTLPPRTRKDKDSGDPIFSRHGIQHIKPFIQRDMLMIENQLPLRLLQRIIAAESGTSPSTGSINSMVLKFLETKDTLERVNLGLHPLDIYRKSRLMTGTKTETNGDGQGLRHPQGSDFDKNIMHYN